MLSKRLIDILGAMVILTLAAPVMLALAVLIYLRTGRPVLFRQVRAGEHGRPFTLYKFRTMRQTLGDGGRPLSDAERLTPLGSMLRRTSLDELPQLINVLGGRMSLVGPRPLLMQYNNRYTPEQARRLNVKPGLTGWSQINGRNSLCWDEKLALDTWYADNWSLSLDAKILLRTFWQVLRCNGINHPGEATMPEFMGTPGRPHFAGVDQQCKIIGARSE